MAGRAWQPPAPQPPQRGAAPDCTSCSSFARCSPRAQLMGCEEIAHAWRVLAWPHKGNAQLNWLRAGYTGATA